jgi:hypothetical protein
MKQGAVQRSSRVQRSSVRVQRSSVVSALGCSTAAPGSIPAAAPRPRPSRMNYLPRRRSLYPAQEDTQQAKSNPRINIVFMYVS